MEGRCFLMRKEDNTYDLLCPECHMIRSASSELSGDYITLSSEYTNDVIQCAKSFSFLSDITVDVPRPTTKCFRTEDGLVESVDAKLDTLVGEFVSAYNSKYPEGLQPMNSNEKITVPKKRTEVVDQDVKNSKKYVQGSLDGYESVQAFMAGLNLLKQAAGCAVFSLKDTMFFLSGCLKGVPTGTGFHWDITRGINVAFAMMKGRIKEVLALWLFISPTSLDAVDTFIRGTDKPEMKELKEKWVKAGGFKLPPLMNDNRDLLHGECDDVEKYTLPVLSKTEMECINKEFPNDTVLVGQCHGDVVFVPPGWVHAVTNLRPNWKLARDYFCDQEIPSYAFFRKKIGCGIFGQRVPADYMSLDKLCRKEIHQILSGIAPDTNILG